jgi:uncharacterized protein YeaO (DUF488 family)
MYLNRLVSYYGIDDIQIIPCRHKVNAIESFLKDNNEFLMFDYDIGINKKHKSMIQKHHANIIICRKHLEHFFWNEKDLTNKDKSKYADKITNMSDEELEELIANTRSHSITSISLTEDKQRCSNLILFLEEFKKSSGKTIN